MTPPFYVPLELDELDDDELLLELEDWLELDELEKDELDFELLELELLDDEELEDDSLELEDDDELELTVYVSGLSVHVPSFSSLGSQLS